MMLECNLSWSVECLLFANVSKSTCKSTHMAQDFVEQLKAYILLSSGASVGWSESENQIYFSSHDIGTKYISHHMT